MSGIFTIIIVSGIFVTEDFVSNSKKSWFFFIGVGLWATSACAQPSFTSQQILIGKDADVQATSINDSGIYAANVFGAGGVALAGAIVNGTTITRLPHVYPDGAAPLVQAIDNHNNILGYETEGLFAVPHLFLIRNGKLDRHYDLVLVSSFGGQPVQPNPIGFSDGRIIFYTEVISFSTPTDPSYGIPRHLVHTPMYDQFQTIRSVNSSGVVAGNDYGLGGDNTVFYGQYPRFKQLLPPGAVSAGGGYINDNNEVAGSYVDASGTPHGFVYAGGKYTSFDMPAPASKVTVTGISDTGRVVGVYLSPHGARQHGFLYNGQTVSSFGDLMGRNNVFVALNNKSQMLLAIQNGLAWHSYLVTCSGSGC